MEEGTGCTCSQCLAQKSVSLPKHVPAIAALFLVLMVILSTGLPSSHYVHPHSGTGNLDDLRGDYVYGYMAPPETMRDSERRDLIRGINTRWRESGNGDELQQPRPEEQVRASDAEEYSRIAILEFEVSPGVADHCSAALVGPNTVVTAAHCLHNGGRYHAAFTAYFHPPDFPAPVGCTATEPHVSGQWRFNGGFDHDWGILQLNCNAGEVFGYFGLLDSGAEVVAGESAGPWNLTGYTRTEDGYQLVENSGLLGTESAQRLAYDIGTYRGQSGSPIWISDEHGDWLTGIHAGSSTTSNSGAGPALTGEFWDQLQRYLDDA